MKYELRFWREVRNQLLHIVIGMALTFTYFADSKSSELIKGQVMLAFGGIYREYQQEKRGKEQPMWLHLLDIIAINIGGWLVWLAIKHEIINPDEL